ncbi:hypothetical protein, partial [Jatrophihabitans sp.]|uniref:hypothetical protein n=1 Tax=Jatrophihabitans sp. TaxID=1932789 RepID=UPI0030C7368C|nr:hypothetical protein [Jatrophihabitans sp.]
APKPETAAPKPEAPAAPKPEAPAAQAEPAGRAEPKPKKAGQPKDGKEKPSQADLRLLRTDAALRNRVIAAVVVPFLLFVVVLLAIGRLDAFAVWLWLPLITAGVVGGLLLDGAHNRSSGD